MQIAETKQSTNTVSQNGTAKRPLFFQPKLTINQPNDVYEQEADAMADKVMLMPDSAITNNFFFKPAISSIQRKCAHCEEEEKTAQRKETNNNAIDASSQTETYINTLSGGSSLKENERSFFEPRMGYDFSEVKIHTDSQAAKSAQAINALAYTSGNNIVFNSGQYCPGTDISKRLLGHELTHVVQQGKAALGVQRKIEVPTGTALNTMGFTNTKTGNVYSSPAVTKSSVNNEIISSMLHSPRTFRLAGSTSADVDSNFQKHIVARLGIVDFASKKKYTFGAGAAFKMNPKFWNNDFTLKSGIDKQKAMDDVNIHPEEYAIACLAATTITMEGGSQSSLEDSGSSDATDWVPGDWGYITNTKFTGAAGDVGLEGENIIYVGKDRFWGHFGPGNTYKTLKDWEGEVKGWNGGEKLDSQRTFPIAGLL